MGVMTESTAESAALTYPEGEAQPRLSPLPRGDRPRAPGRFLHRGLPGPGSRTPGATVAGSLEAVPATAIGPGYR